SIGRIGNNNVYPIENTVPVSAIIAILIAVSSDLDFTIGATAAIAAAPQITVLTPSKKDKLVFNFHHFLNTYMTMTANALTKTDFYSNPNPSSKMTCMFNVNPYKIIANRKRYFDEKVTPSCNRYGYPHIWLYIIAKIIAVASGPMRFIPGT